MREPGPARTCEIIHLYRKMGVGVWEWEIDGWTCARHYLDSDRNAEGLAIQNERRVNRFTIPGFPR